MAITAGLFRERLRKAVVDMVRTKQKELAASGKSTDATGHSFVAAIYEECNLRCNRIINKMIFEADQERMLSQRGSGQWHARVVCCGRHVDVARRFNWLLRPTQWHDDLRFNWLL